MFRIILSHWQRLDISAQHSRLRHALAILLFLASSMPGQESNDVLMRHVPSEFARKKLTLIQTDGMPGLKRGEVRLSSEELFQFIGVAGDFETQYRQLEMSYTKNHKLGYWLQSIARVSLFGTILLGLPNLKPSTQLYEWLPTIEITVFGAYTWMMAKRYNYRAQVARRDQLNLLNGLNLDQWVEDYNLKLYQKLVESGLTFSE